MHTRRDIGHLTTRCGRVLDRRDTGDDVARARKSPSSIRIGCLAAAHNCDATHDATTSRLTMRRTSWRRNRRGGDAGASCVVPGTSTGAGTGAIVRDGLSPMSRSRRGGPGSSCCLLHPSRLMSTRPIAAIEAGCSISSVMLQQQQEVLLRQPPPCNASWTWTAKEPTASS